MSFHFARAADPQLVKEIAAANELADEAFAGLVELTFTILTSTQTADQMLASVEQLATAHAVALETMQSALRAWLTFMRAVQRASLSPKQLTEDLVALGFPKGKAAFVGKQYKAKVADLALTLVGRTLSVNQLVDLQWNFGVTSGSSEFRASGRTFLQLKLTLNKGYGNEDVYMELTLPQFYAFLTSMEQAKASLEFLS